MEEDIELQKVSLDIPKNMHKELKQYCLDTDMKMKDVIIEAVKRRLEK